jgi:hypothetical protein
MALVIKKRVYWQRVSTIFTIWALGISAMIGAPLSQAVTVHSPSKPITNDISSSHPGPINASESQISKNKNKSSSEKVMGTNSTPNLGSINCTSFSAVRLGLSTAISPQLRKLAQYEQVCNSAIISQMSFFVAMPTTTQEANEYATDVAVQLREFSEYGINPLVFLEPTTSSGLINMTDYRSGVYDSVIDTYFATIKAAQITDEMMGTWVPFPEGNLPVWSSLDPNDFATSVTKTITYQKKHFPSSKASILLDTVTYPNSGSWDGGQVASLMPYIKNIPIGLIDSFGLQGFPWSPPANEAGPTNGNPSDYLKIDLATEAARTLGITDIWLNTGTFGLKYANQPLRQITVSPEQRLVLLNEVINRAKTIQSQGYIVSIHLFAEDKSLVPEATDWSYWPNDNANNSPATYVFKTFVHDLQINNISLWLFDTN